jgi:hypothetical protein
MLGWFDVSKVDAFADAAVADLVKRVPPATMASPGKNTAQRLKSTGDAIFQRAEAFAREQPLNLYKKAHLGNRVKWALREAGYSTEFADALSYELVTVVTIAAGRKKA